jgi:rhomboid protease GluP
VTAAPYPPPAARQRPPRTPATTFILSAILAVFVLQVYTGAWENPFLLRRWAINGYAVFEAGQYWRLLTAMFLHGNGTIQGTLLHLMLNVLSLYQLGKLYEMMFGTRRFVLVYFCTGLLASLASAWMNRGWSVGASGAIFGIVGAFIFSVRRSPRWRQERFARSIVNQLVFWTAANLLIGFQIPQIDMSAHIGGLLAGMLLGAVLPHKAPPPPPPAQVVIDVRPYDGG